MKSTRWNGSSSPEYTIFSSGNAFIHQDVFYERDRYNGRCYRYDEPSGIGSRLWREGGMARKRISAALFAQLLNECEARISEAEQRGAA